MIDGFVSTMSLEEKERIFDEAIVLEEKGLFEESKRLMKTIPINPELANGFKNYFGDLCIMTKKSFFFLQVRKFYLFLKCFTLFSNYGRLKKLQRVL